LRKQYLQGGLNDALADRRRRSWCFKYSLNHLWVCCVVIDESGAIHQNTFAKQRCKGKEIALLPVVFVHLSSTAHIFP
jgi:hypothetical protein